MNALLAPLVAIVQQAQAVPATSGTEPLRVDIKGRPMIPVMIDGRGPFDVIVDTGAVTTVLRAADAEVLKLARTGATLQVSGVAVSEDAATYRVPRFASQLFDMRDVAIPGLSSIGTTSARAVVGMDLFVTRKLIFDRTLQEVRVSPSAPAPAGYATVAGRYLPAGLFVPVTINGVKVEGLVDSGAEGSVIGPELLRAMGWKNGDPRLVAFGQVGGAGGGGATASIATMDTVNLGPVTFDRVRMIVRKGAVPAPSETGTPRMILGLDILNQLNAYAVDTPRAELQLLIRTVGSARQE